VAIWLLDKARQLGVRTILVVPAALGMSIYHLYAAYAGAPIAEIHLPLHLAFVLVVLFVRPTADSSTSHRPIRPLCDAALIALAVLGTGYLMVNASEIQSRIIYVTPLTPTQKILAICLILVVLEAARRTVGWGLALLAIAFFAYAFLGQHLPGPLGHGGYSIDRILEQVYLIKGGFWNIPTAVSANYIFIFVLFGALLLASGAGSFFTDLAEGLTGRYAGGTAKTAVVSSGFMSMLSGSAASNVVTTGALTIPAMRRSGYSPTFAAGVEAVASSGGQITPPIMGAAAFLMVEFIGVPYLDIIAAASIPALLYYIAVFTMVDLEARRLGLRGAGGASPGSILRLLMQRGYLLLSVVAMLVMLIQGYTTTAAGLWATVTLAVLTFVFDSDNRRRILVILFKACTEAPKIIAPVAVACAIGGIVAGITTMTGLGVKVNSLILDASMGYMMVALVLTMLVAIIMGMGLPSSGAYVVLAALLAPGLVKMGVPILAAHLFIIFCGTSGTITPPVAIASYGAAAVANTNPWQTSLIAFRLGLSIYIIPFMFVFSPGLLGSGGLAGILGAVAPAILGVGCLSAAIIGYITTPLRTLERLGFFAAALVLIHASWKTDLIGLTLVAALVLMIWKRTRNPAPPPSSRLATTISRDTSKTSGDRQRG